MFNSFFFGNFDRKETTDILYSELVKWGFALLEFNDHDDEGFIKAVDLHFHLVTHENEDEVNYYNGTELEEFFFKAYKAYYNHKTGHELSDEGVPTMDLPFNNLWMTKKLAKDIVLTYVEHGVAVSKLFK